MKNSIEQLQDFVHRALRNYKYKPNTATALQGALKLFSSVMTEDELATEGFIKSRIEELAERLHTKYPQKYSVDSLRVYKSRIARVITDFEKYGADAKSMASWNPLSNQRKRMPKLQEKATAKNSEKDEVIAVQADVSLPELSSQNGKVADLHLPLAGGRNIVIYYPNDLTENEAEKVGAVLKTVAALNAE